MFPFFFSSLKKSHGLGWVLFGMEMGMGTADNAWKMVFLFMDRSENWSGA